jgi:hypothetical protein
MPAVNVDQFHGVAPKLIDSRGWGLADTGATVASDVCAFAALILEVRVELAAFFGSPSD